jgi:hypothetical protein
MGVFVLFAFVLVLEKNLKLFWHFRASLCASLRVGLHRNESPQTSHWSGKSLRYSVREGFEPSVPDKEYNALAKRRFRPLSHLTRILWWERYISEMSGVNRNLSATFKRPGVSSHRKEKRV